MIVSSFVCLGVERICKPAEYSTNINFKFNTSSVPKGYFVTFVMKLEMWNILMST
jgi:hypothetical protein